MGVTLATDTANSFTGIGSDIVKTVTGAISNLATNIAGTVVDVFNKVFVNADGGISNIAIWGLVVGAVGITFGIVRMFTRKAG